ncbi:MAG: zinc metalloprotease HtpX [Chlamydiae bacterium RIFCSPHIGHO2_12_FULL_27_8]|nr:MAG: zinc metalloprotease HtpX [Chlamydiae bacterium RIFCSPHIGHO2_12_FULL_27_8]OGN65319.1 MAG: zinc metalloprotease HtpX [Chlamydiae bacterium RIFCSPLOWO2_01_FULL_28_7]
MNFIKRFFLLFLVNILVVLTVSLILNFFHIQPYLQSYHLNIQSLMIFCLIWGFSGSFISLLLSKHLAKWMVGVKIVNENDSNYNYLYSIVRKIAIEAELNHIPEVGVYESKEINAFATGYSQKNSLIALSTGLINKMDTEELEGVIGHEMSHIKNGDMVTMTLLQGVFNSFVMFLSRILAFVITSNSREKNRSSYTSMRLFTFLFEIIFMILASIVLAFYSRKREYKADIGSANIVGKQKMIKALNALKNTHEIVDEKSLQTAFSNLKISGYKKKSYLSLFMTHPSLDKRIENLVNL